MAGVLAPSAGATGDATESLGKSHGLEYMRAKHADVSSQTAQGVSCDGDAEVTGGGGSMGGPANGSTLNATYTGSAGHGWLVEGASSEPSALIGFAICGPRDVDHEESALMGLTDNTTLHGGQPCPANLDPIGGGARTTSGGVALIRTEPILPPSTPVQWGTSLSNQSGTDTLYEMHAVCSDDDYDVRYRYSSEIRLPRHDAVKAVVHCKGKEAVLGGGFTSILNNAIGYQTPALQTRPWDSKDDGNKIPDDGWQARAYNTHEFRVNLRAVAVCKR
jgi:hypothetical protein